MKQRTGKYLLSFLLALAMVVGLVPGMSLTALATDNPSYTLDGTITGGGSAYADDSDITQNNVSWKVKGNTTYNPWRIGGKSLSGENRDVYSTGTINSGITEVMLELGYSTITVNSVTLTVASDSSFSTVLAQQTKNGVAANSTLSFKPTSGTWSNAYYKFTFNVTNSNTTNKYVQFKAAKFYAAAATVPVTGVSLDKTTAQTIDVDGKVSFAATVSPDNVTDKTVKWSVGGTDAGAVKLYTDADCTAEVGADATETLTVYAKGISAGSATVTCTSNADSEKKASCDVTVNEAAGEKAYAAYDVTTETNKTKSGNDLTALQVTFNERQWYIIEDNSSSATSGTVTLLSADTTFGTNSFDDVNYSDKYSTSQVKAYLDSMTGTGGAFADVAYAIETVNLTTNKYNSTEEYETVNGVKLYLLSTEEAKSLPENVRKAEFTGGKCYLNEWWLRSPGDGSGNAAYVYGGYGIFNVSGIDVGRAYGVRPALKLNLSAVTFSSESKTFSVGSATVDVTGVSLDKTAAQTIEVNGKVSFSATVEPDNATDKTVKWSVGGTDAGAVKLYTDADCTAEVGADATSTLTVYAKGISAGSATITATSNADSTKSASCDVTVNAQTPADTYIVAGNEGDIFDSAWSGTSEANKMTLAEDGTYTKSYEVSQAYSDVQLKVVKNGQVWIGDQNGNNVTFNLTGAGTFTVNYNPTTGVVSVSGDIVAEPAEPEIGVGTTWYVGDSINLGGKYYCYDDSLPQNYVLSRNAERTVPDPEYSSAYNQWVFTESIRSIEGQVSILVDVWLTPPEGKTGTDVPTGFKIKSGDGTQDNPFTFALVYTAATHSVTITAGDHMTKTAGSGDAEQTGLTGAMTDVVYTADNGYYYPTDYSVAEVSGIKVTRDSYTQITVSGTPTADAVIALTAPTAKTKPDAPTTAAATDCTTADNNDGKLTGVTTAMEYKKSDAADWTAGTDSDITGLAPGTYYVRVKATDTTLASDNQELTIEPFERTNPFEGRVYNIGDVLYLSDNCVVNFQDGSDRNILWTAKTEDASYYIGKTYQIPTPTWNESREYWKFPDFTLVYYEGTWYDMSLLLGWTDDANGGEIVTGVKCTGGDGSWESPYTFALVYLPRVEGSAEGYSGTYDGASHGITVSVTDPTSGTTVKYGTTEGTYNLDTSPEYTDAGEYTVYYEVTAEGRSALRGSADISIAKAEVTVTAKDQSIRVNGTVPDLSSPVLDTHYTVSGLVGEDTLTTTPTLAYQKNGEAGTPDNTTAGTYDIVPSGASAGDNYSVSYVNGTLTISEKQPATVTKAPEAKTLTYNGQAQELVTAGTAEGGTMKYAVTTENTAPTDESLYTTSIPTATYAGTYYVWYKVKGDDSHTDTEAKCIEVAISRSNSSSAVSNKALSFTGQPQPLVTAGTVEGGMLEYALGTDANTAPADGWSTEIPTATEPGTYYVWYKVVGDENHNGVDPACIVVTIAEPTSQETPAATPAVPESVSDYTLLASMKTSGDKALKLKWTAVTGAEGYDVFFGDCGGECELKKTVTGTSCKIGKLKKGNAYKAFVKAWKTENGQKVYIGEASPDVHAVAGGKSNKYTNAKKISVKKKKLTVAVGGSKKIKASLKKFSNSRRYLNHTAKIRYFSSNRAVATVNAKGKVTGVAPGTCTVYAVAENGLRKGVKITVK